MSTADRHTISTVGDLRAIVGEPTERVATKEMPALDERTIDGKTPWFVADIHVEQVFSHCSKAFLRSGLWRPDDWADPADVLRPGRTIAERAAEEKRPESEIRREVDRSFEPGLH